MYFERGLEQGSGIGECRNCSLVLKEEPSLCGMTKKISIKKENKTLDGFSAMSFKVSLGDINNNNKNNFNNRLEKLNGTKFLKLSLVV